MIQGYFVAVITPFKSDLSIDETSFAELIERQIDGGADAIVCFGSTGEGSTLDEEEEQQIYTIALSVARGRVPIYASTGSNDTRKTVKRTKRAKECGVAGSCVIVPYYNRPTPEGCMRHFEEVANVGLPLIIYHHPGRTGVKLSVKTLSAITRIKGVVGIKDCSGDLDFTSELVKEMHGSLFTGDDLMTLSVLERGGRGMISVIGNLIPHEWKKLWNFWERGDPLSAQALFNQYSPLLDALSLEINPQCVKYALHLMGKCSPYFRLPLIEPQEPTKVALDKALKQCLLISS